MSQLSKIFFVGAVIFFMVYALDAMPQKVMSPFEKNRKGQKELYIEGEAQVYEPVIISDIVSIHYADAKTLAELIQSSNAFLSEKGHVIPDERNNVLWISDTPENLKKAKRFILQMDRPAKQVRIRAHIVNVDQSSIKELGLKFGTSNRSFSATQGSQLQMDMPLNIRDMGNFAVAIAKLGNDVLLDLELSALEKEGHAKMISKPELVAANRQTASISSGQDIPYQETTSGGGTSTTFKKAVLSLKVTPTITPNNKILLNLTVNQDKVSPLVVNGMPAVSTQEVQTQVLVNNGETIVLGGIYEEATHVSNERVPFLSSIPLLGVLFKGKTSNTERRELLIFVRPEVI